MKKAFTLAEVLIAITILVFNENHSESTRPNMSTNGGTYLEARLAMDVDTF